MSHRYLAYLKFLADRDSAMMMLAAFALAVVLTYAVVRHHRAGRIYIITVFMVMAYSMLRVW